MERDSAPIRRASRILVEKQGRLLAEMASLFMTLGRAEDAAVRGEWDTVRLLLAQAQKLEASVYGECPVTDTAWEDLGYPPGEDL